MAIPTQVRAVLPPLLAVLAFGVAFRGLTFLSSATGAVQGVSSPSSQCYKGCQAVRGAADYKTLPNIAYFTFATAALAMAAGALRTRRSCRKAKQTLLPRFAWGDPVTFYSASVKENVAAADGLRLISIEASPDVIGPFQRAGQFVQAKPSADAKPSFYAISSAPGKDGALEFLIKDAESNAWLTGAGKGDAVLLSPAQGRGYSTDCEAWTAAGVSQVGIFATGSGIAPMRAAIESGALSGKNCRLYYGARTEGAMAYTDRFDDWTKRGVEVVPVISQGGGSWGGRKGYVQDALKEDEERGEGFVLVARHGALLCGQKEMVAAVRQVYAGLGLPEDRTLLNF